MSKSPKPSPSKKTAPAKKAAPGTKAKVAEAETQIAEAKPVKAAKPETPAKAPRAKKAAVEAEVPAEPVAKVVASKTTAPSADDAALAKRLSEMTDFALRAYQQSTMRISRDPKHAKSASAKITLAGIEKEMARRVASPGSAPSGVRVAVASPKQGKKRD